MKKNEFSLAGNKKPPFKSFKALYAFYIQTILVSFLFTIVFAIKNPAFMLLIAKISILCFFVGAAISTQVTKRFESQKDIDSLSIFKRRLFGFFVFVIAITGGMGFSAVPVLVLSKFNVYL